MSKILCKGALGLVILLDNRIVNPLAELDYYSFIFSDLIESTAMVVGVTHRDQAQEPALQKYEDYFRVRQQPWPVFPVDPRKRSDVVTLVSALVSMLEQTIPYYSMRHRVNPGITGWAQICYPYGASEEDAREKLQYDLYYIKNYSLFLDFMVLLQTAHVILWGKGAR